MTRDNAPNCFDYVGIPYRMPPDEKGGMHCWELVESVMRNVFNIKPPDIEYNKPIDEVVPVFLTELEKWKEISSSDRQAGDLVMIRITGYPAHCGILADKNMMLHTLKGSGSVIEPINSIKWRNRILGYYRWME